MEKEVSSDKGRTEFWVGLFKDVLVSLPKECIIDFHKNMKKKYFSPAIISIILTFIILFTPFFQETAQLENGSVTLEGKSLDRQALIAFIQNLQNILFI